MLQEVVCKGGEIAGYTEQINSQFTQRSSVEGKTKTSSEYSILRVCVSLRDISGCFFPMNGVVLVFLHELAHCIAPIKLIRTPKREPSGAVHAGNGDYGLGKGWVHDSHDNGFWRSFADVLRVAESNNIITLPKTPGKFSTRYVQRLDKTDVRTDPLSFKAQGWDDWIRTRQCASIGEGQHQVSNLTGT